MSKFIRNGKEVTFQEFLRTRERHPRRRRRRAKVIPAVTQGYGAGNEGFSISMSVHPSQIGEMNELLRKEGITGVHYDPNHKHNCRITDRRDRARWIKKMGEYMGRRSYDGDGGYGDG